MDGLVDGAGEFVEARNAVGGRNTADERRSLARDGLLTLIDNGSTGVTSTVSVRMQVSSIEDRRAMNKFARRRRRASPLGGFALILDVASEFEGGTPDGGRFLDDPRFAIGVLMGGGSGTCEGDTTFPTESHGDLIGVSLNGRLVELVVAVRLDGDGIPDGEDEHLSVPRTRGAQFGTGGIVTGVAGEVGHAGAADGRSGRHATPRHSECDTGVDRGSVINGMRFGIADDCAGEKRVDFVGTTGIDGLFFVHIFLELQPAGRQVAVATVGRFVGFGGDLLVGSGGLVRSGGEDEGGSHVDEVLVGHNLF